MNFGLDFGAIRSHKIISEVKEYYEHEDFILGEGTLNQVICPVVQTRVMERHGLNCNGEFQVVDGMTVMPSCVMCGMSPHSFRVQLDLGHIPMPYIIAQDRGWRERILY